MSNQDNKQPLTPEQVDFEQKDRQKQELENSDNNVLNPGDKVDESKSVDEKAKQVAVDAPDITGDHITVPTYFVAEDKETGEEEALHHVKDAEKISDVIRQARVDEDGERKWR